MFVGEEEGARKGDDEVLCAAACVTLLAWTSCNPVQLCAVTAPDQWVFT